MGGVIQIEAIGDFWYYYVVQISEIKEKISPVLSKYGVKRASVFGSVSRGEDSPDSDVDLLIELGDEPMGLFKYSRLIEELETSLGKKVDVVTNNSINKFLKPYILPELRTVYER